jgi:hypothetical protein
VIEAALQAGINVNQLCRFLEAAKPHIHAPKFLLRQQDATSVQWLTPFAQTWPATLVMVGLFLSWSTRPPMVVNFHALQFLLCQEMSLRWLTSNVLRNGCLAHVMNLVGSYVYNGAPDLRDVIKDWKSSFKNSNGRRSRYIDFMSGVYPSPTQPPFPVATRYFLGKN